jgi:hypothetical protein
VLVRLVTREDPRQVKAAEAFVSGSAATCTVRPLTFKEYVAMLVLVCGLFDARLKPAC